MNLTSFLPQFTAVILSAAAAAQLVIAPENTFVAQPGSSGLVWRTTAFRCQQIYDTSHFTNQGVVGQISINRLRFRAANSSTSAGGTYTGCTISIGTCATDDQSPSTTFAANRGVMQTVLTAGSVTVTAGAGTTPNNYVIDIPIPGGFAYNPTLGQDLLIEIDAPAPSATTIPLLTTAINQATNRCARVSQNSQSATTGVTSPQAAVVLFDITGGPGGIGTIVPASSTPYGSGCYAASGAVAEQFGNTVSNLDVLSGITFFPSGNRYLLTQGAGAFVPPTGTPVGSNLTPPGAMGDDTTSQPLNLTSFSFPHPGGSTNVLHATTNGYLLLQPVTGTAADYTPTLTELVGTTTGTHSGLPRFCPVWYDLHATRNSAANPAAGVHFEENVAAQTATITWFDVGEFTTTAAGGASFNFQIVLSASGIVEFRYGSMSPFNTAGATREKQVSYNPAPGTVVPISQDLSALMPFLTSTTSLPLTLAASGVPLLGTNITLTTSNVPVPGVTLQLASLTQINPGVDLGVIGMPGCNAYVNPDFVAVLAGVGSAAFPFAVPASTAFAGQAIFAQSLSLDANQPNPFGGVTSNGLRLLLGTVN